MPENQKNQSAQSNELNLDDVIEPSQKVRDELSQKFEESMDKHIQKSKETEDFIRQQKLESFSIMSLQGILAFRGTGTNPEDAAEKAVHCAKTLLKRLEQEANEASSSETEGD